MVTRLGGEKSFYGPRQNMDITHPAYLFYSERIIRKIISHYRNHPAIIGYQIDNETGSYGTAARNVQLGFVDYLKKRFKTTVQLNKIWGLAYWGQLLNGWGELPPRDGILNPGYKLEWERYQQKIVTDFLAWQASIVNEYKRPDQFVTQNFVGGIRTNIDEFEIARHRFGKGTVTYEGTVLSDPLQSKVLADVLKMEGLIGPDQDLPSVIRVKSSLNAAGKNIRFYLNYSGLAQAFKYPHETGTELLTQRKIGRSEMVSLAPWDLAIIEER